MLTEVIFDLETQKLFSDIGSSDPADLGVSIVSVYRRILDQSLREVSGQMHSFWKNDIPQMWDLFAGVNRVIGFNSKRFDIPALRPLAPPYFSRLPHFDILEKIRDQLGHNLSLNTLARDTLGQTKTDHGTNAVIYWQSGDPESLVKLRSYCEADVFLTRNLYDHLLHQKCFKYIDKWNTHREANIDISYPASVLRVGKQIGLF